MSRKEQCEPGSGGPSRITFSRRVQEVELAEVLDDRLLARERWKVKSNSSSVLRAGKRAALMRPSPPWLSRRGDLGREQRLGEALIAPLLLAGAVGELRQRPRGGRRLQRAEQVRQLGRRRGSCRDQLVVAGQRPDLDVDLVALAAPRALAARARSGARGR